MSIHILIISHEHIAKEKKCSQKKEKRKKENISIVLLILDIQLLRLI